MFRNLIKGWFGEKMTQAGMWLSLNANVYLRLHDVIVPSRNGTTQIDHVLISAYGIFVLETKNYKGWIFGDEHSPQWTVSHFGRKFKFQNPLRQNYRHIQCLREHLQLPVPVFHSVVFFIGDCKLKTSLPSNVLTEGLSSYIRSFATPILDTETVRRAHASLEALKMNPSMTKAAHLQSLEERHESTTTCPKCGAPLVQRVARTGRNAGQSFLGCKSFPRCCFTRQSE